MYLKRHSCFGSVRAALWWTISETFLDLFLAVALRPAGVDGSLVRAVIRAALARRASRVGIIEWKY